MRIQDKAWTSFANNRVQKNQSAITKTLEKLSGGDKIVRASLNASGLSISEAMRTQIKGLSRAQQNMQDGLSVLEVTDSGLQNVNDALHRGRELAVQAANDTLTENDRYAAQKELDQLMNSINDTANHMEFNTHKILGEVRPIYIQAGANSGQILAIDTVDVSTKALDLESASLETNSSANELIAKIDKALAFTSKKLTDVGADYNAISMHHENVGRTEESLQKSESLIRDPDMALEMMDLVKQNIVQKGDELLIQSTNRNVQSILGLFK